MGARIKEARQARGWSQQDLAERVRVSQPTIVHWEQGTHTPRNLALARLADALGVSRQWLQDDTDSQVLVSTVGVAAYHKSTSPIQNYLSSPIHHVPVFDGPLNKESIEACLNAKKPAIGFMAMSIPVLSAIGWVIDDPEIEQEFPKPTIAVIECADRTLVDGRTYFVQLDGLAKLRRWGAYPARFEADDKSDPYLVTKPPEVLGRLLVIVRQY
jgi:transcriptional regulator with XRE-family HTH domain